MEYNNYQNDNKYWQEGQNMQPAPRVVPTANLANRLNKYQSYQPQPTYNVISQSGPPNHVQMPDYMAPPPQQHLPPQQPLPQRMEPKQVLLDPGSPHIGLITHVENGPLNFYLQLKCSEESLAELNKIMNTQASYSPPLSLMPGTKVMCRSEAGLRRCCVQTVLSDSCIVFNIDFGNTEEIHYNNIFNLPNQAIDTVKPLALQFCLAGISDIRITPEMKEYFKNSVLNKQVHIKVAEREGPHYNYCELNYEGCNIKDVLIDLGSPLEYTNQTVRCEKEISVIVSHVDDPGRFYVQYMTEMNNVKAICQALNIYASKEPRIMNIETISIGSPVAVLAQDNVWYRALVIGFNENKVSVFLVDYGKRCDTNLSQLCAINRPLVKKWRGQSVECYLNGFENKAPESAVAHFMEELVVNKVFTLKLISMLNGNRLSVDLIDNKGNSICDIIAKKYSEREQELNKLSKSNHFQRKDHRSANDLGEKQVRKRNDYSEHDDRCDEGRNGDRGSESGSSFKSSEPNQNLFQRKGYRDRNTEAQDDRRGFRDRERPNFQDDKRGFRDRHTENQTEKRGYRDKFSENDKKGGYRDRFSDNQDDKRGHRDRFSNEDKPRGGYKDKFDDKNRFGEKNRFADKDRPRFDGHKKFEDRKPRRDYGKQCFGNDFQADSTVSVYNAQGQSWDSEWLPPIEVVAYKHLDLQVNQTIRAYVVFMTAPNDIYVQLENCDGALNEIRTAIDFDTEIMSRPFSDATRSTPVMAVFPDDTLFYRAIVRGFSKLEKTTTVMYVDYGNSATIPSTDVYKMTSGLARFPAQTVRIHINNIPTPPDGWPVNVDSYYSIMAYDVLEFHITKIKAIDGELVANADASENLVLQISNFKDTPLTASELTELTCSLEQQMTFDETTLPNEILGENQPLIDEKKEPEVPESLEKSDLIQRPESTLEPEPVEQPDSIKDVEKPDSIKDVEQPGSIKDVKQLDCIKDSEPTVAEIASPETKTADEPMTAEETGPDYTVWNKKFDLLLGQFFFAMFKAEIDELLYLVSIEEVESDALVQPLPGRKLRKPLPRNDKHVIQVLKIGEDRLFVRFYYDSGECLEGRHHIRPIIPFPVTQRKDKVYIVHRDEDIIYLHRTIDGPKIQKLLSELFDFQDEAIWKDKEWNPGQKCCAKGSDGNWYRAEIIDQNLVKFIDYGNTETVEKTNIKTLNSYFNFFPEVCIKAKIPLQDSVFEFDIEEQYELEILSRSNGFWYVDLIKDNGERLTESIIKQRKTDYIDYFKESISVDYDFEVGKYYEAIVSHVDSINTFCIQLCRDLDKIEKIQQSLSETSETECEVFAALYEDGNWYRAVDDENGVRFIDYGNTDKTETRKWIQPILAKYPGFAIPVRLCVEPIETWSHEDNVIFTEFIEKQNIEIKIVGLNFQIVVDLISDNISLSDLLIENGAVYTHHLDDIKQKKLINKRIIQENMGDFNPIYVESTCSFNVRSSKDQLYKRDEGLLLKDKHFGISDFDIKDVAASFFPDEALWYRVKAVSKCPLGNIRLDLGNDIKISGTRVFSKDVKMPEIKIPCSLDIEQKEVQPELDELFLEYKGDNFKAKFKRQGKMTVVGLNHGNKNVIFELQRIECENGMSEVLSGFIFVTKFFIKDDRSISEISKIISNSPKELSQCKDGDLVVCQYKDVWYRAVVTDSTKVFLLDSGNHEIVDKFYQMPDSILPIWYLCEGISLSLSNDDKCPESLGKFARNLISSKALKFRQDTIDGELCQNIEISGIGDISDYLESVVSK